MTAQADPYVRVYYRIIDDPKFAAVFDDDSRLACWLRLLLVADATYPAPAPVPAGVRKGALAHLAEVGLVDICPGNRFRIHGMDAERGARSEKAAAAAAERWQRRNGSTRNAPAMQAHSVSSASASGVRMHSAPLLSAPLLSAPLRSTPAPAGASKTTGLSTLKKTTGDEQEDRIAYLLDKWANLPNLPETRARIEEELVGLGVRDVPGEIARRAA